MNVQRFVLATLAAGVFLVAPLGSRDAQAFERQGFFFPYYTYPYPYSAPYQFGGGAGVTEWGFPGTWGANPYNGYSYYAQPQVYSYSMPSPYYGVLPPVIPALTYASGQGDGTARRRRDVYPAVPYEPAAKKEVSQTDSRRVRFDFTVPQGDAELTIDGAKTKQTGTKREYITPPLELDRLYSFTVEVQWTDGAGKKHDRKKTFEFIAGETVKHSFE